MYDWSGGVSLSPEGRMLGHHHVVEDDKEVIELARQALLDHGGNVSFQCPKKIPYVACKDGCCACMISLSNPSVS